MKTGIDLITEERNEQIEKHGWDKDDEYTSGDLSQAAIYCLTLKDKHYPKGWSNWFYDKVMAKKKRMSVFAFDIEMKKIAGALIAAEIDRIQISEMNSVE